MTHPPRIASDGSVYCPARKGDAAIETCLSCEWLEDASLRTVTGQADQAVVRCAPPRSLVSNGGWVA